MKALSPDDACMGVDIESGSPESRNARYSIILIKCGGSLIYKAESASLAKLIRIIWEYKPKRLGIDNIYELGGSERRLFKILSLVPPELEIFQVTLLNNMFLDVRDVARRAGILEDFSKMNPMKTAYTAAILACMGYGTSIRSVEEKTIIQISKVRSHSSGGWSQRRYQRRVRATIYNIATSVREALDGSGLDYDYYYRESSGGLESAVFTVYAPINVVEHIIKEVRSSDYIVKVRPVYRSKLLITPVEGRAQSKPVIVGVDPGVTTGIAIIDLDGRVLHTSSSKAVDRGSILELVSKYGRPVIVSVDVSGAPESVRKLAAQLGASLYTPSYDMSVIEKRELIEKLGESIEVRNSHERDALAAAYKAYLSLREKLDAIEGKLGDIGVEIDKDEIKRWVLEGLTIADALERAVEKAIDDVEIERIRVKRREDIQAVDISEYIVEIEKLRLQREALETKVKSLEESLREYERKLGEIRSSIKLELLKDTEIEKLRSRIESLERELTRIQEEKEELAGELIKASRLILRMSTGELTIATRIPTLTTKNLRKLKEQTPKGKWDVIIVDNPHVFEVDALTILEEMNIEAVLIEATESPLANALRGRLIPVLDVRAYELLEFQGITLVSRKVLEDARMEKERLESLRKPPDIERIIEEYRTKRKGLIKKFDIKR